jgi:hypothetical protein
LHGQALVKKNDVYCGSVILYEALPALRSQTNELAVQHS